MSLIVAVAASVRTVQAYKRGESHRLTAMWFVVVVVFATFAINQIF
jgi:hypothetical protein